MIILYEDQNVNSDQQPPHQTIQEGEEIPLQEIRADPAVAEGRGNNVTQQIPVSPPPKASFLIDLYSIFVQESSLFVVMGAIIKSNKYYCQTLEFITEFLFLVYTINVPLVSITLIFYKKEPRSRKTKLFLAMSVIGGVFFRGTYLYALDLISKTEVFCASAETGLLLRFFVHFSIVNTTTLLISYVFITCFMEGVERLVAYSNSRSLIHT